MIIVPDFPDDDRRILEGERLFLTILLNSPDGTATLTQATPPDYIAQPFPDGGKWRGCIPKRLAGRGIIVPLASAAGMLASDKSSRAARNGGLTGVWRLVDPAAGRRRKQHLDQHLAKFPGGLRRNPGLFDGLDDGPGPVPC